MEQEQEPHSLSGHGSTSWVSAHLELPFPLFYCLLLQRNLWKGQHSHEGTVGSEGFQPLTSQCCVEALLPEGISWLVTPSPWNLQLQLELQGLSENKSPAR